MAFYDFKCERCGFLSTHEVSPREIGSYKPACHTCKQDLRRIFTPPKVKVAFRAGHDPYTGKYFNSQVARDAYIADNGLVKGSE